MISSRVRLARNLRNYRFPNVACDEERKAVLECVQTAVANTRWFNRVNCVYIDTLSPLDRRVLEEKHLISPLLVRQGSHRLAIIAKTSNFSMLVNEEDHLRIQAIRSGMQMRNAWNITKNLERSLKEKLDFAYSDQYGYITTCSTNTGTGMRVSIMMFLPGLIMLNQITPILQNVILLGYTVRGMYGEGSKSRGYLLQISKQGMYGNRDANIPRNLERICCRIIEAEKRARFRMLMLNERKIRDYIEQVCHSLSMAKQVGLNMGMKMLATLRLGIALNIKQCRLGTISGKRGERSCNLKKIDELFIQIQPAHVAKYGLLDHQLHHPENTYLSEQESEDVIRAKVIRQQLGIGG